MSSKEHKQKIWNYIKDIKVGMLTTMDGQSMIARPMHIVQKEYDGTLWFFTKTDSDKVSEIQDEHDVGLTFCNHKDDVHVSLSGRAKLVRNQELIDLFWNPFIAAWFPDGKESPSVALLEVKIHKGAHWDSDDSKARQLYEIAKSNVTGDQPDIGEHEKFGT